MPSPRVKYGDLQTQPPRPFIVSWRSVILSQSQYCAPVERVTMNAGSGQSVRGRQAAKPGV